MRPWLTRGAVLAVLHAAADTLIAYYRVDSPTALSLPRGIALGVLVGIAALWAAVDGLLRKVDRGTAWVGASVLAGLLAAVLGLVAKAVLLNQTDSGDIWPAMTGGAAFTALLVLLPAGLGLAVGGAMQSPRKPVQLPADPESSDDAHIDDADLDDADEKPSPRPRRHRKAKLTPPG